MRRLFQTFLAATIVASSVSVAVGSQPAFGVSAGGTKAEKKRPCHKHTAKTVPTKKTCLKAYKRSRMAWPPKPTEAEIKKRVGTYHWNKAARVANCETGGTRGATANRGNLNWYPNGTYQGPLGMYRQTARYGKRATGYHTPKTWQQWVAVAVASHPITKGWSGWGCRGA